MNKDTQGKLLDAGFTIYRQTWDEYFQKGKITYVDATSGAGNWRTHSKDYPSKAAMFRAMATLLYNPMHVEA